MDGFELVLELFWDSSAEKMVGVGGGTVTILTPPPPLPLVTEVRGPNRKTVPMRYPLLARSTTTETLSITSIWKL